MLLDLAVLGVCVIAACVSAWYARQARVAAQSGDVVELGRTVERIARAQRSDTMRRVRAAAPTTQAEMPFAPPELVPVAPSAQDMKAQLRRQFLR